MGDHVGNIVNGLAMIGAAGVVVLIVFLKRKLDPQLSELRDVDVSRVPSRIARRHIEAVAKTQESAIEGALTAQNPAESLATLGNERRKE